MIPILVDHNMEGQAILLWGTLAVEGRLGLTTLQVASPETCYNVIRIASHSVEMSMAKKQKQSKDLKAERPERVRLSAEESLKRLQEFPERKELLVAAVRKGKDRGVSA